MKQDFERVEPSAIDTVWEMLSHERERSDKLEARMGDMGRHMWDEMKRIEDAAAADVASVWERLAQEQERSSRLEQRIELLENADAHAYGELVRKFGHSCVTSSIALEQRIEALEGAEQRERAKSFEAERVRSEWVSEKTQALEERIDALEKLDR